MWSLLFRSVLQELQTSGVLRNSMLLVSVVVSAIPRTRKRVETSLVDAANLVMKSGLTGELANCTEASELYAIYYKFLSNQIHIDFSDREGISVPKGYPVDYQLLFRVLGDSHGRVDSNIFVIEFQ